MLSLISDLRFDTGMLWARHRTDIGQSDMGFMTTRPGVHREPGIFGRKLSVGATLDIGR